MSEECLEGTYTRTGNGQSMTVTIPIIEMQPEVMSALSSMLSSGRTHCIVNNTVVIQNGLITSQVGLHNTVVIQNGLAISFF